MPSAGVKLLTYPYLVITMSRRCQEVDSVT